MLDAPDVFDVFTPSSPARLALVDRRAITERVAAAVLTPGRQLLVYGPTGAGKTSVLQQGLDVVGEPVEVEVRRPGATVLTVGEVAEHADAARAVGRSRLCIVYDDVHRFSEPDRRALFDHWKGVSDLATIHPGLTQIALAAVDEPGQLGRLSLELESRLAEVEVPPMARSEVTALLEAGAALLGIDASAVLGDLVRCSGHLPGVAHQLMLDTCLDAGILRSGGVARLTAANARAAFRIRHAAMPRRIMAKFVTFDRSADPRERLLAAQALDLLVDAADEVVSIRRLARLVEHVYPGVGQQDVYRAVSALTAVTVSPLVERVGDGVRFRDPLVRSHWAIARVLGEF